MQLGAKGYVTKNSSREEMLQAIHEVFKGRTYVCKEVLGKM
jgi:DNA-binding NarL/FixJ family response regulator